MFRALYLAMILQAAALADEAHWAYLVPELDAEARGATIDDFISARLRAAGLALQAQADPARLLRRLHLDLVGLPPSIAEVDAFVADPSDAHYEAIVDRLLAEISPNESPALADGRLPGVISQ